MFWLPVLLAAVIQQPAETDLAYLRRTAQEVVDSARVAPGASIFRVGRNTTGFALRVPGGTQSFYPAFWIRDAAMMLGADLVPASEIEGWIRVVAAIQPGPEGLKFPHGLVIPPYSIPDHITLGGVACWFPGAYADQGVGDYGFLPPADDAFYFIQMLWSHYKLTGKKDLLTAKVKTGWGEQTALASCIRAFDSVETDPTTGLVVCSDKPGMGRVDWGFCDSITKIGQCLMPSILRWQAANRLAEMCRRVGLRKETESYRSDASLISKSVPETFFRALPDGTGLLLSATGLGKKDDVWASAFAVSVGILPRKIESKVAKHLLAVVRDGGTVLEGQVRQMPPTGEFGGYWEKASSGHDIYQNGGYWATPTGWLIAALKKVDATASTKLLNEYVGYLRPRRAAGAPYEWINPKTGAESNANYGSSAGLVYCALREAGFYR